MASFRWKRADSARFGSTWLAVADVEFRDAEGDWRPFALTIDTGSVITLLRRSALDLLGLDWTAGREVELNPVGPAVLQGKALDLACRIGEVAFELPVVVADHDDVPNLLGRLGIVERFRLELDPVFRTTVFRARWLTDNEAYLHRRLVEGSEAVCTRLQQAESGVSDAVREASGAFLRQAGELVAAVNALGQCDLPNSPLVLVRSLFELSL